MEELLLDEIRVRFPVKIGYDVLEDVLRDKLIGKTIKKEKNNSESVNYAEVLDLCLEGSRKGDFSLLLNLKLKTLTTILSRKEINLAVHLSIDFNKDEQTISIRDYELDGRTNSWLMNNVLETVINRFLRHNLMDRMKFDIRPQVEDLLSKVNKKLESPLEVSEGIFLSGYIKDFIISDIIPGTSQFLISIETAGHSLVDIKRVPF